MGRKTFREKVRGRGDVMVSRVPCARRVMKVRCACQKVHSGVTPGLQGDNLKVPWHMERLIATGRIARGIEGENRKIHGEKNGA